jgi:hypothetical protein
MLGWLSYSWERRWEGHLLIGAGLRPFVRVVGVYSGPLGQGTAMGTLLPFARLVTAVPTVPKAFEVLVDEEMVHTIILLKILINGLSNTATVRQLLRSRARNS